jgi:acyl carrier protein
VTEMIEERIQRFLIDELDAPPAQLTMDYPLIERGVLDSLGIVHLVSFLESEYHIEVEDLELTLENFRTIRTIAGLVGSKQAADPRDTLD